MNIHNIINVDRIRQIYTGDVTGRPDKKRKGDDNLTFDKNYENYVGS